MPGKQLQTTKLNGGGQYAKVADRMKEFRQDWPKGKSETDYKEVKDEAGNLLYIDFKAWLWKDKSEFMELVKAGVTDVKTLRSTADADGAARAKIDPNKEKEFEKLQTIALGRALALLGYMASGEIASFEEMEEYYAEKQAKLDAYINEQTELFENAKTLEELRDLWIATTAKTSQRLIDAKNARKAQLEDENADS